MAVPQVKCTCLVAQVLWASAVKWRLRPAPPEELYELGGNKAAVRGSCRLAHTDYCKYGPFACPESQ